ncbi:BTB/POZ domain containing protein [Ditylenchus destructor]|uniref:BTB/POZ domain containing protein n=1 Tax=Ditylenchus destructor TaxID=166010 RepID=A0AAD4N596_9BILA|nr:BTB/POZ domain containing protein [Ditylenchus destructor]
MEKNRGVIRELLKFEFELGHSAKEAMDNINRAKGAGTVSRRTAYECLEEVMDDDFFYRHCFRLGRSDITGIDKTIWRWLGFFFGSDLLMNYCAGTLRITRNCANVPVQQRISVRMSETVRIHYRVIVCSDMGKMLLDTQKRSVALGIDRSVEVGSFKVPKSSFSVHLFYLAAIPGPSSCHYWDNFYKEGEKLI